MSRPILHIGFPKTGSSTIQVSLARNRRRLVEAGWRYAYFSQFGREAHNHSGAFVNLFSDNLRNYYGNLHAGIPAADQRARYGHELEANFESDLPLIFSAETVSSLSLHALEAIRAEFERRGPGTPRVIAFIRPPGSLLTSMAQQKIRNGWTDPLPGGPLANLVSRRVQRIRQVFPDTEFYPFADVKAHEKGPMGFFADLIRPGLSETLVEYRRNEAVSSNAISLIQHLNRVVPVYVDPEGQRLNPLRLHGDNRPLMRLSGRRYRLTAEDLAPVADQIASENAWLAEHLGPEYCDAGDPPVAEPETWTDAQGRELRRLLRRMPHPLRVAVASYFEGRDDVPAGLRALPGRYRLGGDGPLRTLRSLPGIGTLEWGYRKLRRQW